MKLQFFSDIHLEFGELAFQQDDADVIVAAGDIGLGLDGLDWLRHADCPVVYVAGNHEYYNNDFEMTLDALRTEGCGDPVHFLENDVVEIDGVRFLGTTLWTNMKSADPDLMLIAQNAMNDYNQITYRDRLLRPNDTLAMHEQSCQWLIDQLERPFPGTTVVVSHHAPSYRSWGGSNHSVFRHTYCNNLDGLLEEAEIDLWIHGHVHTGVDYRIADARVVCNARGYAKHQQVPTFDLKRAVEI